MKKCLLLALAILMFTCKKQAGPQGPKGDPGTGSSVDPGNIVGKVRHYDESGNTYTTGLNTTTVSIDGTTNSTVTDMQGNYKLTGILPGIYTLTFQSPGKGLVKHQQLSHPGNGDLVVNSGLFDKASWTLTSSMIKDTIVDGSHYMNVRLYYPAAQTARYAVVFFSRADNIVPENINTYDWNEILYLPQSSSNAGLLFLYNNLNSVGYSSGTKYFAQVFPANTSAVYYDYAREMYVYTGVGTPVASHSLTLP